MRKEFKCYTYICDNCGIDLCKDTEVSGWNDEDYLEEVRDEANWITDDGKDYCFDCYRYFDDEGDSIVIDESRKDKYKE